MTSTSKPGLYKSLENEKVGLYIYLIFGSAELDYVYVSTKKEEKKPMAV